jgi:hypothetical protein
MRATLEIFRQQFFANNFIGWPIGSLIIEKKSKRCPSRQMPSQGRLPALPKQAPEEGEPFERIFTDIESLIVPGMVHWGHSGAFHFSIGVSF